MRAEPFSLWPPIPIDRPTAFDAVAHYYRPLVALASKQTYVILLSFSFNGVDVCFLPRPINCTLTAKLLLTTILSGIRDMPQLLEILRMLPSTAEA